MSLQQPPPSGAGRRPSRWRGLAVALPITLVVGFGVDACNGLPVSRGAASPGAWLAAILALGGLYLLGESAGDTLNSRDKVTDPLWRRCLHLAALLALWVAFIAAYQGILRLAA
jgi:hypothetical protein